MKKKMRCQKKYLCVAEQQESKKKKAGNFFSSNILISFIFRAQNLQSY